MSLAADPLYGPYGSSALPYAHRLAGYNCNAIWFHGFDPVAFEAAARHGLAACVEFKTFRTDFVARPDLVPIGADRKPIRYGELVQGVCLSRRDFMEETEAHLLDGLRQYRPAGIWLDYLTYAGWFETPAPDLQESCFCADCIVEFCEATGSAADTPGEILSTAQAEWTRHKCERIAALASHYAGLIRAHLPGCIIGAYMCPWTPAEFDAALSRIFAQDYALLAASIDVFTPLIYAHKSGRGPAWGAELLAAADGFVPRDREVQLILDVLDFPASLLAVAESAHAARTWGIQMFAGASIFADDAQAQVFARAVDKMRGS
jgi:hypothetical protein